MFYLQQKKKTKMFYLMKAKDLNFFFLFFIQNNIPSLIKMDFTARLIFDAFGDLCLQRKIFDIFFFPFWINLIKTFIKNCRNKKNISYAKLLH